ncbi:putative 6-phosphofructokinase [Helianthus annuus]|uniref:6-phosphofructokinase n=1 Tax=Helianthus annuus TaxID=4232 RepID=A0A9K3JVM7_HELAN|nr:putative 6-phosphofructokinase [Helianthus annuus]KAJ0611568.1 putative 6-phosphofructokinase [Helianthus annuus]KAJ0622622.1 putative 6-phosphofructokinase [Helianthus annuus]KAJ0626870.1 putative 6-phosphofructokinase [Helianthus annuus]KAJ0783205.1 putative 6-phosphofructokinase [Helianthus annuus]
MRPLGVVAMILGIDDENGPRLFKCDPAGHFFGHKGHFKKQTETEINLKYIDPTYMIRAVPSNASDNVYCALLAHSAVHGAMVENVTYRFTITEKQNKVVITDRMWARMLSSTNQPSFLNTKDIIESDMDEAPPTQLLDDRVLDNGFVTKETTVC